MNYLAHAWLSGNDPQLLTGNMIADFVKGRAALAGYPAGIQKGILLHRFIDAEADRHPAVARAKLYFRPAYRLYSGAIVDTVMDHFLANDAKAFPGEPSLQAFSGRVYDILGEEGNTLPDRFRAMLPHMRSHDWLYNYRTLPGIRNALGGLYRRASQMPPPDEAYAILVGHYYIMAQCYYELIDDLVNSVNNYLRANSGT